MDIFVKLLKEKQCQLNETPELKLDPIQIVIDKRGRVFSTGDKPYPYTIQLTWCNYEIEAVGRVKVVAAMKQPPIWGLRFRPKAYLGVLPLEPFYGEDLGFRDVVDAGVMLDFLYYDWANLNATVGYRSVGMAVGIDLTENFGAAVGYGLTWGQWHHSVVPSLWFGF
jgi:hypothetical protein